MLTTLHTPYDPIDGFTQPLSCAGRCNQEAGQSDENSDDRDTHANKREYILLRPVSVIDRDDDRSGLALGKRANRHCEYISGEELGK